MGIVFKKKYKALGFQTQTFVNIQVNFLSHFKDNNQNNMSKLKSLFVYSSTLTVMIRTSVIGRSKESVRTAAIESTTSIPSITSPYIV